MLALLERSTGNTIASLRLEETLSADFLPLRAQLSGSELSGDTLAQDRLTASDLLRRIATDIDLIAPIEKRGSISIFLRMARVEE